MKNFPIDPNRFKKPIPPMTPEMAVEVFLQNIDTLSRIEGKPATCDDLMCAMQGAIYATKGLALEFEDQE